MFDSVLVLAAEQLAPFVKKTVVAVEGNTKIGNIIKNEVLYLVKIAPTTIIKKLTKKKLKETIKIVREFSFQFYKWRKRFVLRQH